MNAVSTQASSPKAPTLSMFMSIYHIGHLVLFILAKKDALMKDASTSRTSYI